MKIDIKQKLQKSLFLKILLVFVVANVTIIGLATLADDILIDPAHFSKKRKSNVGYSHYIIKDLGIPPNTLQAKQLADSLDIQIRFESDRLRWASHDGMIDFDDLDISNYRGNSHIRAGYQDGIGACVAIQKDDSRYLFVLRSEADLTYAFALYNIIVLVFATIIIVALYFVMRSLLQPVKMLHTGVKELSKGNMEYTIPTKSKDELGELVSSFNSMTNRIKEMIRAREQLLLDVSHELRSPLTRVKVAMEFLDNGQAKSNINDDVVEMETMITEILESQRLNSPYGCLNLQHTNLSTLLKEVCRDFNDHKPGLELTPLAENVVLHVDPERTRILLKNVITNAIKYSDTDGRPVRISLDKRNGHVVVGVQDFGAGIPETDLPHIFEPFYRVDKSRSKETGGYGLGMNLSKQIVEAHGGQIEISSQLNEGTTVCLKFPNEMNNQSLNQL